MSRRAELLGTVLVIAKEPRPGHVKTRLVPPLRPDQAADVAAAALWDTLRAVARVPARELVLAFDGDSSAWAPEGWRSVPQPGGGLDERLVAAFAAVRPEPAVLVGMDTPQLCAHQLAAFDPRRYDACLGAASDGGYWAIGFRDPAMARDAITGVPMSTPETGAIQLERLRALGLRVQILDELTDVDTIETAREVARLATGSAFTAALARALLSVERAVL